MQKGAPGNSADCFHDGPAKKHKPSRDPDLIIEGQRNLAILVDDVRLAPWQQPECTASLLMPSAINGLTSHVHSCSCSGASLPGLCKDTSSAQLVIFKVYVKFAECPLRDWQLPISKQMFTLLMLHQEQE